MRRIFFLLLIPSLLYSCKNQEIGIKGIEGHQITVTDSLPENPEIEQFIAPYRERIAKEMDSVLAYSPIDLDKKNGQLNTAIGNMMADAVMQLADPIFRKRTGKSIDVVLLNFGGIRSTINKGDITTRTAFQVMPFENEVIVAEMKGEAILQMINYLIEANTAHPFSGLELWLNETGEVEKALIQGKPIKEQETYYVATNDYLFQGGDNMTFFSSATDSFYLDYKIRNILIDYFSQNDTIAPVIDQRFIRK